MSDTHDDHPLLGLLQLIETGNSVYGPIGSPLQTEKVAELRARIGLGRELGEIAPEPPPIEIRVRQERLDHDFPGGDPAPTWDDNQRAFYQGKLDAIAALGDAGIAKLSSEVAADLSYRATQASLPYASHNRETGGYMPGTEQLAALVKDAEPAVRLFAPDAASAAKALKLLRADRDLLELFAVRGRNMTRYAARKVELKL
jgi:hypothetical protein